WFLSAPFSTRTTHVPSAPPPVRASSNPAGACPTASDSKSRLTESAEAATQKQTEATKARKGWRFIGAMTSQRRHSRQRRPDAFLKICSGSLQAPNHRPRRIMPSAAMQILVVEDEAKVARALQEGLGHEGYEVTVARTGEEGYFLLDRRRFD